MALVESKALGIGSIAPDFQLIGVDGQIYTPRSFLSSKLLLINFMCNHCPYVIATHARVSELARRYRDAGLAVLGVNSNDPNYKEEDSFENMKLTAQKWNLPHPYVFDESQAVAKAYHAQCTPDPYLFEQVQGQWILRYQGRIDDSWKDESQVKEKTLENAIQNILSGLPVSDEFKPSMGCSIKWKELTPKK